MFPLLDDQLEEKLEPQVNTDISALHYCEDFCWEVLYPAMGRELTL